MDKILCLFIYLSCLLSLKLLSGRLECSTECLYKFTVLGALGGTGTVFRGVFRHPLPEESKGFELIFICCLYEVVYIL